MKIRKLLPGAATLYATLPLMVAAPAMAATPATDPASLLARIEKLEQALGDARHEADMAADRGDIENLFSNYMYLHNAFQDEKIKALWAKRGTPGMSAQYSNNGVYTSYDSIMAYHTGRPTPTGKLIFHYTTTPSIQVAGDRKTAKGVWIAAGQASQKICRPTFHFFKSFSIQTAT